MQNKITRKIPIVKLIKNKFTGMKSVGHKNYGAYAGLWQSYYNAPGKPVWSSRNYEEFSDEGFIRNVIAHQAINLIAKGAASVQWLVQAGKNKNAVSLQELLRYPNPSMGASEFFEAVYTYKLINGNAYIQAAKSNDNIARELFVLRPDRVSVIAGKSCMPAGYRYIVGDKVTDFKVDRISGQSDILHIRNFHPLNDWYGLSSMEAAAYSIDQHNQAGQWNQSLLQNGARPSGALIVKGGNENGYLSEEQYNRIKSQMEEAHSGAANAGRPLLLEGGLEWKEMSLSPKDMDFLNVKNSAARDIALSFGVPSQLLGIPGDNTYNNMEEARLALWEQTIIPLLEHTASSLNNWLVPMFGSGLNITYDKNSISALMVRREALWSSLKDADFITDMEKRQMVGL